MVMHIFLHRARLAVLAAAFVLFLAIPQAGFAQQPGSILLWPVNPTIEADRRATALWLENPGKTPITMQVRIFAWAQAEGKNVYAAQNKIVGSPPLVTIQPGEKQLVRLTRTVPPPAAHEDPYRIVVDEIPTRDTPTGAGAAVRFRMRYALPLFVHGTAAAAAAKSPNAARPAPMLDWRITSDDAGRFLEIRNSGATHARLVDVAFTGSDGTRAPVTPGLLGYVLPASIARWPLADGMRPPANLVASVNGTETVIPAHLVD